jgi:integrase
MAKLTTKCIENVKPAAVRREIPDSACRGLYLVVQPTGRKAWAVRYRFKGTTRKLTLDSGLTLAEARKAATAALHELERGNDPAALKFDARAKAAQAAADRERDTVEALVNEFIEHHAKRKTRRNSWKQTEHVFHKIVLPVWRGRIIHDVERRHIRELVENVAVDRPVLANRTLAHLSKFFNWLCERDVIKASPCAGVKPPAKEQARDRVLNDDEIKTLWRACGTVDPLAGPAIQLMLLTGQRCGEVVGMRRSEISGDVWTLLPERTKNKQRHEVPLSRQALAIIDAIPGVDEDYLFTSSPTRRLGNMAPVKVALDTHMKPAQPWVLHDLRRTVASGMARLGVRLPVIEKVLNHVSGSFRGIVGVYQRHEYAAEKRDALQRWANHVEGFVTGKAAGDKIVQMTARR